MTAMQKQLKYLKQHAVGTFKGLVHEREVDGFDDARHGGSCGEIHVVLRHLRIGHTGGLQQIQYATQVTVRQSKDGVAASFSALYPASTININMLFTISIFNLNHTVLHQ